jgi:hypothetical protein
MWKIFQITKVWRNSKRQSSWWLLVLTPGSALPEFWGFSLGKHLQFVMWQIWYHHMRYYNYLSLCCSSTFKPMHFVVEVLTVNQISQYQHGGSETSAALEFAVNTLQVENVLVVGHSRCGGIQALMSMKDDSTSGSFIKNWVSIGKSARLSTKAAAGNLNFEMQCTHCEKETISCIFPLSPL